MDAIEAQSLSPADQLHVQIEEADVEMRNVERDCGDLQDALEELLSDFMSRYPDADTSDLLSAFGKGLADVMDDMQGPAFRRKCRAESDLADLEDA